MNLDEQILLSKKAKETWLPIDDRGDIPPVIFIEKDGKQLCQVFAPEVNRDLGLMAAELLKMGFDPDTMVILMDAHFAEGKGKMTEEEFAKKFPPGSMQKMCDEQGACELGLITDCILSLQISRDGKIRQATIPYSYHGKGTPFRWFEDRISVFDENNGQPGDDDDKKMEGLIPDALREIMAAPAAMQHPVFQQMASSLGLAPDAPELQIRVGRSILPILANQGFMIVVSEEIAKYGPMIGGVQMEKL